jgi:RNAse (barnase) inhibitor barstar
MTRGMRFRASNEDPRAGGRGPRADAALDSLTERVNRALAKMVYNDLKERIARARAELNSIFDETKSYFNEAIDGVIREFKLTEEEVNELNRFKETLLTLLDRAHEQARTRLEELDTAHVEKEEKTLKVATGNAVALLVTERGSARLPLYGISATAYFPPLFQRDVLEALQLGWAASDEGQNGRKGRRPLMGTSHPWQIMAWAATRPGRLRISVYGIFLRRKGKPSIAWRIVAQDWHYVSKREAWRRLRAKCDPLSLLTLYLGDGKMSWRGRTMLRISVGNTDATLPKSIARMIVKEAYATKYGDLLDMLKCEKWEALKMKAYSPRAARLDPDFALRRLFELAESPPLPQQNL